MKNFSAGGLLLLFIITMVSSKGVSAMEITSPAFVDQGTIPKKYVMPGAGGSNLSLPLQWRDVPPGTKSLALSIVDPHPIARNWVHWLVINIPPTVTELPEGASGRQMPPGARELRNSFGDLGYGGPQPPRGSGPHPYVVTLYALAVERLELPEKTTLAAFQQAIEGKVLATATITGIYER